MFTVLYQVKSVPDYSFCDLADPALLCHVTVNPITGFLDAAFGPEWQPVSFSYISNILP